MATTMPRSSRSMSRKTLREASRRNRGELEKRRVPRIHQHSRYHREGRVGQRHSRDWHDCISLAPRRRPSRASTPSACARCAMPWNDSAEDAGSAAARTTTRSSNSKVRSATGERERRKLFDQKYSSGAMPSQKKSETPPQVDPHLRGHLARQPERSICGVAIRAGGLWFNGTLRAMGRWMGHCRSGPQSRLDNRVNARCCDRGVWWADAATDRDVWREWDMSFVDAIAPYQPWELAARSRMRGKHHTSAKGVDAAAADAHGEEDLPIVGCIDSRDTNADTPPPDRRHHTPSLSVVGSQ